MPEIMKLAREMREGLEGVTDGPWSFERMIGAVGCVNAKIGGFAKLFDVRGWGYFTGSGHGGLGLPDATASKIHDANGRHVARCSPDNIRILLDHIEAQVADRVSCQARVEELERALRTMTYRAFADKYDMATADRILDSGEWPEQFTDIALYDAVRALGAARSTLEGK